MDNTAELEKLFNSMVQLNKLMSQRMQDSQEERAATLLQYSALTLIKDSESITVTELADFLKLSKSSATQLVERLVVAGLVARKTDQNDKRVIRLLLTTKGNGEMSILKQKIILTMNDAFADIPKKDILELTRIHENIITSLKKKKHEQN